MFYHCVDVYRTLFEQVSDVFKREREWTYHNSNNRKGLSSKLLTDLISRCVSGEAVPITVIFTVIVIVAIFMNIITIIITDKDLSPQLPPLACSSVPVQFGEFSDIASSPPMISAITPLSMNSDQLSWASGVSSLPKGSKDLLNVGI